LKILLVEDSEDTLTLLSAMFAREGATVIAATSAADALRWASTNQPDIVISDIGMPDVDGFELLEKLKQMPKMNGIPAIAISGYASDEDRRKAIGVGYLALVPKPLGNRERSAKRLVFQIVDKKEIVTIMVTKLTPELGPLLLIYVD
jgi:two-component system CheB/CheR fusion protein